MAGLISLIVDNFEVAKLTREEADKALFCIEFYLDHDGDYDEVTTLSKLKSEILQYPDHLDSIALEKLDIYLNFINRKKTSRQERFLKNDELRLLNKS